MTPGPGSSADGVFTERDDGGTEEIEGPPPAGPRRLLIALYAIFALAATARAVVQLTTQFEQAPLAYVLSAFSGVVYLAATVGLVSRRAWSRPLAWAACGTEMAGVLIVGFLSVLDAEAFPKDTVWSHFGSGYGYFPVLLPVLGLLWLGYSRNFTEPAGEDSDARR
ncbi:hypothetical protein J2S58_001404 [Nakamurella flavida]|nr:hypothetical protein [Nakamurella flavida]MDP9777781.1 hypothetical protein [Nakamurella flavida]